jgi:ankyrin repeat protein
MTMRWLALLFLAVNLHLAAQTPPAPVSSPAPTRVVNDKLGPAFRSACWRGDLTAVKSLYEQGAPLEGRDNKYRTGLFLASHGDTEVVRYLLSLGANVEAAEDDGDTPFCHACEFGDLASAQMLIDAGAKINIVNKFGRTPLMMAAREGHDTLVSLLISHHVDVNFHDPSPPALFFAIWRNRPAVAKLLLDAGADPQFGWSKSTDPNEMMSKLMGWLGYPKSADPNEQKFKLMMWAAGTNDPAMVDLLLDHGLNVNVCDQNGMTVLMKAVQADDRGIVAHLLDKGADPNAQQDDGQTALMLCVNFQQPPCLQSLLDHGAKLEMRDKQGRTALIWACYAVYDPNIQFLVEHGADVNATDSNGETPLTYAGSRGDTGMVKYLLAKGAACVDLHIFALPKPNPPLSAAQSWALAVGAIYAQTNGTNPQVLGGDNPETVEEMRANLKKDWDVKDKASFLNAIDELRKTGHRTDYQASGILLAGMSDQDFNTQLLSMNDEQQVEARTVRAAYLKWRERSGLAWDLCREANLIGFGYHAQYITEEEAWPLLLDNARQVQASFKSWQEMSDNFLDGREVWANGVQTSFAACAQLLCNPKDTNSPWNQYPWATDLSAK